LTRFKQRYGIRQITVQGEKLSCDEPAIDEFKKFTENEGFISEQIFNAVETGLYWKCLSKKNISKTETSAAGHKAQKTTLNSFVLWKR
jgi:hypothetical protein